MNATDNTWFSALREWLANTVTAVSTALPSILTAIAIVALGWLVANLFRHLVRRTSRGINRLLERFLRTGNLAGARLSTPVTTAIAEVSFWIIIFIAITIAVRVAGLTVISGWLNKIVLHLPNLIVGLVIVAFGYFCSIFVGRVVDANLDGGKTGERQLAGKFIRGLILTAALIIGLDQVGVHVTFLIALLTVVVGAVLIGFSVAFGLGARRHVSNLIGARVAHSALQVGLRIRVDGLEGDVLEISASYIVLDTASGKALIPARVVDDSTIEILSAAEERDHG